MVEKLYKGYGERRIKRKITNEKRQQRHNSLLNKKRQPFPVLRFGVWIAVRYPNIQASTVKLYMCMCAQVSPSLLILVVGLYVVEYCVYIGERWHVYACVGGIHACAFPVPRFAYPEKMAAMKAYGCDVDVVHSKAASRPRKA